ncbi:MAG: HU family DNA-binding protein [Thermodesulfobacteriota bacterium]
MTKAELVGRIAEVAGITKKAAELALNSFVKAIHTSLSKDERKIRVADLGTFKVIERKARKGVNPQTRKKITIPASKVPRFSAAGALKAAVKGQGGKKGPVKGAPEKKKK